MAYTTVDNPELFFQTKLYTGTGSALSVTFDGSEDMQPDWVWCKGRDVANLHALFDSVRGTGKALYADRSNAEENQAQGVTSFDSDGFSMGTLGDLNASTKTFVSWNWKAGGSASSNSDGTITSSVSANTTAGFSIVSYTSNGSASQTVGHGLGAVPHWIIAKNRDSSSSSYNYWTVYHHSLATANDKKLKLNETEAASTTNLWGDADPTTTKFYVHTSGDGSTNVSTDKIIAYCFTGIKGYSKFGTYTGNGNADGAFAYTGFRPAWVMVRDPGNAENWLMYDNKRPGYNLTNNHLFANTSDTETASTANTMDLLSNGFKVRSTNNGLNRSGSNFLYMALAESPFVNSNGVPTNAR